MLHDLLPPISVAVSERDAYQVLHLVSDQILHVTTPHDPAQILHDLVDSLLFFFHLHEVDHRLPRHYLAVLEKYIGFLWIFYQLFNNEKLLFI